MSIFLKKSTVVRIPPGLDVRNPIEWRGLRDSTRTPCAWLRPGDFVWRVMPSQLIEEVQPDGSLRPVFLKRGTQVYEITLVGDGA